VVFQRVRVIRGAGPPQYRDEPCHACDGTGRHRRVINEAWLREMRLAAGLSQAALGRVLRVSASHVNNIERRVRVVSLDLEQRLLKWRKKRG
jgi:DNA-binding transcriptional regulator YiaG